MSILYHYCSLNTFLKIINSKQLLMNDISKCNDEQELKIIKNFVINSLNIFYSKNMNCKYVDEFKSYFLHTIIEWFDENKQIYKYFISCLSLNKDSELMWSRYGDNDKGICIGFDKKVLTDFQTSENNKVLKVEYIVSQDQSKSSFLDEIMNLYNDFVKCYIKKSKKNIEFKSLLDTYGLKMFEMAICYKDGWWKDENEYRIINWYVTNDQCNGINNCEKGKFCNYYCFNLSNGTKITNLKYNDHISNFHKFLNFEENKDIVKEVIIGPKNPVDYDYIIELLRANSYNVDKISVSKSLGMVK